MGDWSTATLLTCLIFGIVATFGIFLWIRFLNVSTVQYGTYLLDRSAKVRWGLVDVLVIAFVWLASQALTLTVLCSVSGIPVDEIPASPVLSRFGVVIGIVQLLTVGFSLVYLIGRYRHDAREFGLEADQLASGIRSGLIAFAMWIPVVWSLQTILVLFIDYSHPSFDRISASPNWLTLVDTWIPAVIVAPIVEEILFRGIVQGWIQRFRGDAMADPNYLIIGGPLSTIADSTADRKPKRKQSKQPLHLPAILITSLLFGLAHFSQGPAPVSLFVLSVGLGYLYQRTGSLVACIVVHMLLNAITMLLFSIEAFTS